MNPIRAINPNKQRIDKLIGIYLDSLVSLSNDAGWTGESMLSRLIQFEGEIPAPTRNDQSNMTMINAMQFLRNEHAKCGLIRKVIKEQLGTYLNSNKVIALLSKHYYRGLVDGTDRVFSDRDRMQRIGRAPIGLPDDLEAAQTKWESAERAYRRDIQAAYGILASEIDREETRGAA